LIKLVEIWKEYELVDGNFVALENANLEIKKGEFSSILGPSGSGKSTLMHIIGLLDHPTRGKIYIE